MLKLLTIVLGTTALAGCAMSTPIERAEALCKRFGDPSPACIERQFNAEQAREDAFHNSWRQQTSGGMATPPNSGSGNNSPTPATSGQTVESQYDRMNRELKENCKDVGGVYTPNLGGGGHCQY